MGTAVLIAGIFRDEGAVVDVSHSAEAARAQALRRRPTAIILHLGAPRDAALVLTERLRQLEVLSKTRIIVLSWESDAKATAVHGADVVLYRPFSPERVRDELLRLLRGAT
ncbi:MAG: hypothetical protein M1396_05070 [Chloroflexi bacterium]|nr:hypothetical protein [Chloroflexota bacterium]